MTDIGRNLLPLKKYFTLYSAAHKVHSRRDYLLMNVGDSHIVKELEDWRGRCVGP